MPVCRSTESVNKKKLDRLLNKLTTDVIGRFRGQIKERQYVLNSRSYKITILDVEVAVKI